MSEHWVDRRLRASQPPDDGGWATSPEGEAIFGSVKADARAGRDTSVRASSGWPRGRLLAAAVVVLAIGTSAFLLAVDNDEDASRVRAGEPDRTTTTGSIEPPITSPTTGTTTGPPRSSITGSTTAPRTTPTTGPAPPPTTAADPSPTTTPEPPSTTAPAAFPRTVAEYTAELVRAWGRGDRMAAARYAQADPVTELFALADPGGPAWDLSGPCEGAGGTTFCAYRDPSRPETVLIGIPTGNGNVPDGPQEVTQVVITRQ